MKIQFEIQESLNQIRDRILSSDLWVSEIREETPERMVVIMRDPVYKQEAHVELYEKEVVIYTAWSRYQYHIYENPDGVWCLYTGAYRGLLEQTLLPEITPKESLLDSEVVDSTLFGQAQKRLREYAEENLKLKNFRRDNFDESRFSPMDHPRRVCDAFIKEDFIPDTE